MRPAEKTAGSAPAVIGVGAHSEAPAESSADGTAAYRADIDGLRALAILLVVVYHVWLGRVSGGVDVFLMISAFFLTASFARRIGRKSPLRVGTYWLRKFSRLLPAAAVTLVGVLITAFISYPPTMWAALWRQTWASLFYVQNWELAFGEVDYYARDEVLPSPLQHFWSLSVQGQVFVLWPLIFLAVALVVRRTRARADVLLALVFGAIFVTSLVFSIFETLTNQNFAYFDTRTRLWEFAAGSLVAMCLPYFRAPEFVRAVLGWLGLVGIVACGIVIDVRGGFPGYLALWPVLCTAAVIIAGASAARGGPSALLSSAPMRILGRDAYALYLVHWPVLITWLVITEQTSVGPLAGAAVIIFSVVLARVIAALIESPTRYFTRRNARAAGAAGVIIACVAAVAIPVGGWQTAERVRIEMAEAQFAADYPGARALASGQGAPAGEVPLLPDATALADEWVALDSQCVGAHRPTQLVLQPTCAQLDELPDAVGTAIVVGDSHAQQWMGAVLPIARAQKWNVVALLKGGCSFAANETPLGPPADDCVRWRHEAERYIVAADPVVVIGMATKTTTDGSGERALAGLRTTLDALSGTSASIILLRDNPRFHQDAYACAVERGPDAAACATARSDVYATTNPARFLNSGRVHVVDLSDHLCTATACAPVVGNVAVYLDDNHLTWMYATTLAPILAQELEDARVIERAG